MKVQLRYVGCLLNTVQPYMYNCLCANGHADIIYDTVCMKSCTVEMLDELWTEGSGWIDVECDHCGTVYRERTRAGRTISCPVCGYGVIIPEGVSLEESNL